MTDTTRESVERLMQDCALAEKVMKDGDIFLTGQAIFADATKTLAALLTRAEAAEAERDVLQAKLALAVEALTPSGETKAAYIAEVETSCPDGRSHTISWTATKDVMKMIRARAQLTADTTPDPRIEGWNAAIEAAAEIYEGTFDALARLIRTIPCPYTPKEGKDDDQ